ncbi:hypothetical protein PG996_000962 [Apiospora saccharicola]|uniref:Alpha/beta hydrolase fold-3 domain-containing protein n=1 Tax=Apiospora saccharicola TaxID=335842 RepID=A0ABR1WFB9_9PEZI
MGDHDSSQPGGAADPMAPPTTKKKTVTAEDLFEPHVQAQYDPKAVELVVWGANSASPAQHEAPLAEVRKNPSLYAPPWCTDTTGYERVSDDAVPSTDGQAQIPVKVYCPDPTKWGEGPYGVHLNFHGGGHVLGDLTTDALLCLNMREGAGVVVVDVNYRHCPEATWGKGIEDGWAAVQWVCPQFGRETEHQPRLGVSRGISAGATISLVLQHLARDAGVPLRLCMATVPGTDKSLLYDDPAESPYPSFTEFANGPVLPFARIRLFGGICFPRDELPERLALVPEWWTCPLQAPDFGGLCDTLIRTGAVDPLRDEAEAYGFKLVQAGNVKVTMKRYTGCPHMWMYWRPMPQKHEYDQDSIRALRDAHGVK